MLARLQQLTTLALLGATLAWLAWAFTHGHAVAALPVALLILFCHAPVLGLEFLLLGATHGDDPTPRASAAARWRAWWAETLNAPRVFCWRQPFRSHAQPDLLPADAGGRRGVLLVHGFVCNRGFWNPWLARLRAAGVPVVAVSLEPVFGSIDAYPSIIEQAVRRLEAATGAPPLVVAHSMGGLAVRAWLAAQPDARAADVRVAHVITIGTPHRGTWLGRFGRSANTRQMRAGSPWLSALAEREPASRAPRFTCFYSNCDNIVFPPANATLRGADNRHLPGWSHVHLAAHPAVFAEALRRLQH
jgi:triacylglycerol esterase/lipase EstA (alpha/beta hydrolase family)